MNVHAQLTGLHARSEALIDLTREYDRNRVPWEDVDRQLKKETSDLVELQQSDHAWNYVSDGALSWKDQLRPLVASITGLAETTRYSRWYDTNTFYQKPIVTGEIALGEFESSKFLDLTLLPEDRPRKVTLPGPYTLATLSEGRHYNRQEELLQAFAEILRGVVGKLRRLGVELFQLSEPSLVYWPYRETPPSHDELKRGIDAIGAVIRGVDAEFIVSTFFGDAVPVFPALLDLGIAVGVDLYETDWKSLPKMDPRAGLVLGIVDSEESWIESPHWIAETARKVSNKTGVSSLTLAPNTDLKFVPRSIADQKLASLGKAVEILKEGEF